MEPKVQIYEASERKAGTERSDIPEGFPKRASNICLWRNSRSERERVSEYYL